MRVLVGVLIGVLVWGESAGVLHSMYNLLEAAFGVGCSSSSCFLFLTVAVCG